MKLLTSLIVTLALYPSVFTMPAIASPSAIVQPAQAKTVKIGDSAATVRAKLGQPRSQNSRVITYFFQKTQTIEFHLSGGRVSKIVIQCGGQCG